MSTENIYEEYSEQDIADNKVIAALAYIIFFLPLIAAQGSKFARYHANQALVLFLLGVANFIIGSVPILGWMISVFLSLFIFVLAIIGIVNALGGKAKPLPLIGGIKIIKN